MDKSKENGWIYIKNRENYNKKTTKIIQEKEKNENLDKKEKTYVKQNEKNTKNIIDDKNIVVNNNNINEYDYNNNIINEKNESHDDDNSDDNNTFKKILCHNMIYNGLCKYGDKCLYAHSLDDQNVNKRRKDVYDILKSNDDLSYINLRENYELYRTMLEMTKYCKNCNNNLCKGGYNCKSGVYDKKYCICINDLQYGICHNYNCNYMHLTKRGLKPYNEEKYKKKSEINNNDIGEKMVSNEKNDKVDLEKNNNNCYKKDSDSDISNFSDQKSESELSDINSIDSNEYIKNNKLNDPIIYIKYVDIICNKSIFTN
jgi:hypothetical protein